MQVEQWLGGHAGGGGSDGQVEVQSTFSSLTHGYAAGDPKIELVVSHVPPTSTHGLVAEPLCGSPIEIPQRGIVYLVQLLQVSQNGVSRRTSSNAPPRAKLPICPPGTIVYRYSEKYSLPSLAFQYLNSRVRSTPHGCFSVYMHGSVLA